MLTELELTQIEGWSSVVREGPFHDEDYYAAREGLQAAVPKLIAEVREKQLHLETWKERVRINQDLAEEFRAQLTVAVKELNILSCTNGWGTMARAKKALAEIEAMK